MLREKISKSVQEKLDFLLKSQYWPLYKLKKYQWEKLKKLLSYSYQNVPYYRDLFDKNKIKPDDIKTHKDFKKIPILPKEKIQQNFNKLVSRSVNKKEINLNSTGGSTGTPLHFYQNKNYRDWADAASIRAWKNFIGFDKDELEGVFWGAERDIGKGLSIKKILYSVLRKGILPLNTFDLDAKLIKKYIFYYNLLKPKILRGYASSLFYIANFIEENKLKIHHPKAIISSAEVIWPHMREKIEQVFKAKVYDSYGCREVSQIATECEAHNGLHIVMENQYVELINNNIIVTNLNNFAMPFIRYKVGDMAESISDKPCKCGRNSLNLKKLMGRDNDNIILNKKVIYAGFFQFLFFGYRSVEKYQVIYYKKSNKLQIRLKIRDKSENISEFIKKKIYDKFKFGNVEIIETDKFNKIPTGKFRYVYSVDE